MKYGMGHLAYVLIRIKSTNVFSVNLQPGIVSMAAYIKGIPKFWRQFSETCVFVMFSRRRWPQKICRGLCYCPCNRLSQSLIN